MKYHPVVKCRSCEADMFWAVTTKNRRIPIDPQPVETGNIILGDEQPPYGYPLAMVLGKHDEPKPGVPRYTSHFATCSQAASHRRR